MKTIEITVSPKGETKIETKGFVGSDCQRATHDLEQALGSRESQRTKSEFFEQVTASQDVQSHG